MATSTLDATLVDERTELATTAAATPVEDLDAALVSRLRRGDGGALAVLLERHGPPLFRFVFRLSGSREEAEEVVQDAFLRLYERPPEPRETSDPNLGGWLRVVAARIAFNVRRGEQRRRQREGALAAAAVAHESAPEIEDPSLTAERAEERQHVRLALAALPERQRRLLLLRHSGLRYAEIAAALGVSPGSVGALLSRAERSFRAAYAKER